MTFKPEDHIMKLTRSVRDGDFWKTVEDDYLEVKWRLVWFRDKYPNGTIETQEMCVDLDREVTVEKSRWVKGKKEFYTVTGKGYARYKATVCTGEGGRAEGTKTETAADFPDFVEKAETGAIGRALASLGFGTQFTGGELEEGPRIVDGPVKREPEAPVQTATSVPETPPQEKTDKGLDQTVRDKLNDLYVRAKKLGICTSDRQFVGYVRRVLENPHLDLKYVTLDHLAKVEDDLVTQEMAVALEQEKAS